MRALPMIAVFLTLASPYCGAADNDAAVALIDMSIEDLGSINVSATSLLPLPPTVAATRTALPTVPIPPAVRRWRSRARTASRPARQCSSSARPAARGACTPACTCTAMRPTISSYARTDLSYRHQVSRSLTVSGSVHNLLDRDSRLPSPLGSVGGIPDDRISASVRAGWTF